MKIVSARSWVRFLGSVIVGGLLTCIAIADPPKLLIPQEVRPNGQYVTVIPDTDAVTVMYIGLSGVDPVPSILLKDARVFLLDTRGLPVGFYKFAAVGAGAKGEQQRADFQVIIGKPPTPIPPTPIPPGPDPGPDPPTPTPAPIGINGNAVMIIDEVSDRTKLPISQLSILTAQEVRTYLNSACVVDPTFPSIKAWRMYEADQDLSGEAKAWQDAFKRKPGKDKMPWIIISNGKTGYEGPLPKTIADTLQLLKDNGVK